MKFSVFGIAILLALSSDAYAQQQRIQSTTSDTGSTTRKQYEYNTSKSGDTYIYGGSTTTYPSNRYPGQDYQPRNPSQQPRSTYDAGVGFRF
jgi:hypothetical protein